MYYKQKCKVVSLNLAHHVGLVSVSKLNVSVLSRSQHHSIIRLIYNPDIQTPLTEHSPYNACRLGGTESSKR